MIYRYLLSAPKNLSLFEMDGLVQDCRGRPSYEQRLDMTLNILRCCRQCRSEAAPMFWELNTLDFRSTTNHQSFDSVSHFFTRNILGASIAHRILHCVDQTNVRFLDHYLAQVPNLAQLFTKCKTLDLEVTNDASRHPTMSLSQFDAETLEFALAFTLSHPTLVKAIRTRAESVRMAQRSVASMPAGVDDEDWQVKHLHFVTEDYVLKNGVRLRSHSVVTAPCPADECMQETAVDLEAELAEL
jgi:hypothetical protein